MTAKLRVEIRYDKESGNWSYTVPSLGIVGGEDSREAAKKAAFDALVFTLEADSAAPAPDGGDVEFVDVQLGPLKGAA
jgi:hypothetical protein